jgi:hypothetical protein
MIPNLLAGLAANEIPKAIKKGDGGAVILLLIAIAICVNIKQ